MGAGHPTDRLLAQSGARPTWASSTTKDSDLRLGVDLATPSRMENYA
jgi:hypothetical protein